VSTPVRFSSSPIDCRCAVWYCFVCCVIVTLLHLYFALGVCLRLRACLLSSLPCTSFSLDDPLSSILLTAFLPDVSVFVMVRSSCCATHPSFVCVSCSSPDLLFVPFALGPLPSVSCPSCFLSFRTRCPLDCVLVFCRFSFVSFFPAPVVRSVPTRLRSRAPCRCLLACLPFSCCAVALSVSHACVSSHHTL